MATDDANSEPRHRPPEDAGEREALCGLLDVQRATAINKVLGLTTEQAVSRPIPSTTLTPAGIIKHLTGVERFWFSIDFAGADLPWPWPEDDPHGNFPVHQGETIEGIVQEYRDECERSRQEIADADFDQRARGPEMSFNLRYAIAHMIEETARHCGHLDLLRESIDGTRGE